MDALSRHVRLPVPAIPWSLTSTDVPALAEERAAILRQNWNVPPGPVGDVVQVVERHGIVIARHQIETAVISAYSVPFPERPVLVLNTKGAKRDRDRFSVSHEVGHLTMHEANKVLATKGIEAQAHRFAAAFLMPADEIRDELPSKADWVRLIALKQRWQVSINALLCRANDLNVMSDTIYTQAMRTVSTRGWRTEEPGELGAPEAPRLLALAIKAASINSATLAAETGWPVALIEDVLAASGDDRPLVDI
jgi:Zn-dependent peptidase ImmA (M78 family)